MNSEFSYWLCYVKLLVCDSDKNSCQWDLVYCSIPAEKYNDLVGFQNEKLTVIAIFQFHPTTRCAIAELDEPEQIKVLRKVLIVENDWMNFSMVARRFMRVNLVAYYGFDVETVMQLATNKQVDIIIVKSYGSIYEEVDWAKNILILKSNAETAQIPIILKWGGQFMASDRERFSASGVDDFIQADPGNMNCLIEKIQHTLSANDYSQNTTISLKKKVKDYRPVEIQKESLSDFIAVKIYQFTMITGQLVFCLIFEFLQRYSPFRKKYK
ncbi:MULTISPECIES: hypothetical protein [unclassified Microcoleus]|uniref:hypothetical protein n=1 Tax=unclassified Microcoleus TaxID=2642155 RepID=UPI002FD27D2E